MPLANKKNHLGKKEITVNAQEMVFHPFLFAIYPIIVLYFSNKTILSFHHVISTILLTIVVIAALLMLSFICLKNMAQGGLIVSLLLAWFFFFRFANENATELFKIIFFVQPRARYSLVLWTLIFIVGIVHFIRKKSSHKIATTILNRASLLLTLFALSMNFPGTPFRVQPPHSKQVHEKKPVDIDQAIQNLEIKKDAARDPKNLNSPDIYYIILDSYTRYDTLKRYFDFDNKEFYNYLHKKGFYIAEKSLSNYQNTATSLRSSLNMDYLDHDTIDPRTGIPDSNIGENNRISSILKSKGYRYIWVRAENEFVNSNFKKDLLYREMLNYSVFYQMQYLLPFNTKSHRYLIESEFDALAKASALNEKKFVFAHFLCPHPPFFVFGPNGEEFSINKYWLLPKLGLIYVYHIMYVNRKMEKIIDTILRNSKTDPIIIVQGDHGSVINNASPFSSGDSKTFLTQRMTILNAYHLPRGGRRLLYPSISPVNTFKLILNYYFKENYNLLKDESWFIYYDSKGKKMMSVRDKL